MAFDVYVISLLYSMIPLYFKDNKGLGVMYGVPFVSKSYLLIGQFSLKIVLVYFCYLLKID